ncbi:sensor domain-containing diguanylate cyclase [Williamsia sterculiae]|nr:sensor domain-containing diguanylate cyclase [Williamsia sterculiae]
MPLETWAVTRYDGERQVYLTVADTHYGLTSGDFIAWSNSMCQYSSTGRAPHIAHDVSDVPEYAALVQRRGVDVGCYVGYPLRTSDGTLFGTVCGFGPRARTAEELDHDGLLPLVVSLLANVLEADLIATAVHRDLEAARRHAETDSLTGLLNRNGWEQLLRDEEARFRRFGEPGAVVVVDLDRLKHVNDTLGHHAGDNQLRRAAEILIGVVDESSVIARTGGDEFAVLLDARSSVRIDEMEQRIRHEFGRAGVSASLGCAQYRIAEGLDCAWRTADALMYKDKLTKRVASTAAQFEVPVVPTLDAPVSADAVATDVHLGDRGLT